MIGKFFKLLFGGTEKFQPYTENTNEGIVCTTGVNRTNNRQLWFHDSAHPVDATHFGGRVTLLNSSARIGAVSTDGTTTTPIVHEGGVAMLDGDVVPATRVGFATIFVDVADGDLKVKFGDGTIKTIVIDT